MNILDEWKYKGYLNLNFFSDSEVSLINDELDKLRLKRNSLDASWGEYEMYSHPHKDSDLILSLFAHPKIIKILELTLENVIEGTQSLAYFKPPGELGRDMHQDAFYTQSEWNKTINVLIFLDDSNTNNGCLWSYESSHFLPILPIEIDEERVKTNSNFWRNERGKACIMPEGHNFVKVYHECKAGDVLFAHSHLVHGSDENRSDKYRRSIVLSYKVKDAFIKEGKTMKRESFDVYKLKDKYENLWVKKNGMNSM